jgi:hypothetical protein
LSYSTTSGRGGDLARSANPLGRSRDDKTPATVEEDKRGADKPINSSFLHGWLLCGWQGDPASKGTRQQAAINLAHTPLTVCEPAHAARHNCFMVKMVFAAAARIRREKRAAVARDR